jgi:MFS family permease
VVDPGRAAPPLPDAEIERGKRALVQDGAWANAVGALSGGVILVGFALALGAGPAIVGVLGALPFLTQVAQLPAINLIERVRRRRLIAVASITGGRVVILAVAVAALALPPGQALWVLVGGQVLLGLLGATGTCAWNAWIHDFLPRAGMGAFFARRLLWAAGFSMAAGLGAGFLVDHWPGGDRTDAFSLLFALAAAAGFVSSWWLARVPEPPMAPGPGRRIPYRTILRAPLEDENFRRLIAFMVAWNFASNLAAPFFAVYLLQQLGFGLGLVMSLSVLSQLANMLTLRSWGRLSDRFSNKSVLGVAAPLFLGSVLALPFVEVPERHVLTVPMLAAIHLVMGAATAGVGLATGNIALKLAPYGSASLYLASNSLYGAAAAGVAPLVGGAFADWFAARELLVSLEWLSPARAAEITLVRLRRWDFFFVLAFLVGLYAIHRLSLVREEGEVEESVVAAEMALATRRAMRGVSTAAGLLIATIFPFGRHLAAADGRAGPGRGGTRVRDRASWSAGGAGQPARRGDEPRDAGQQVSGRDAEPGDGREGEEGDPHPGTP